jgi:hypothetical protein
MTYSPALPPRQHQSEALRRLQLRPQPWDVFAWLMDMGTGKTKVVLDEFGIRHTQGELDDLLVVAPSGSYRNWFEDREGNPSEATKHLDPGLRSQLDVGHWRSGAGTHHRAALRYLTTRRDCPRLLCVNVEALSRLTGAREVCMEFMAGRRVMMVVDESTRIRGNTKRTRAVQRLGQQAVARRIATGLVAPRDPLDLYNQFAFLDWRILGFRTYWGFRQHHAVLRQASFNGRRVDIVVGFRNLPELNRKIGPWSYRVLKEDCLDLPPKVYMPMRLVDLTDEQKRLYADLRHYATAHIEGDAHVTATNVLAQVVRLQQLLCGFVVDEQGTTHEVPENRTAEVLGVLEEYSGSKAIVWAAFDHSVRRLITAIGEAYGPESVAAFWGGNAATRREDEHRFKTDPRCRFMVATPGAGGLGNTWVVADLVIYHSDTYDLELRSQSEDRAHRDGQVRTVRYIDLMAPGTVDERIKHALRAKINLYTTITGENYREWLI